MSQTQQDLREQLREYMGNKGYKQSRVAKHLGLSISTISTWLRGEYGAATGAIDAKVNAYLQQRAEKERDLSLNWDGKLAETRSVARMHKLARMAVNMSKICVCVGEPGYGKTVSIYRYVEDNPSSILIEADPTYCTPVVLMELHRALKGDGRGSLNTLFQDCVNKLRDSERLIIVDEAEHLPVKALECLRRMHDKAGVGLLLVGTSRLVANLKGSNGDFAQLYGRVSGFEKLDQMTVEDAEKLIDLYLPQAAPLSKALCTTSGRNPRTLVNILGLVAGAVEAGKKVTVELIEDCKSKLILQ